MNLTAQSFGLSHVQARLARLQPNLQQLPPPGSRPLVIAGRVCGWITPRAVEAVAALSGVRVDHEAVHIYAGGAFGHKLDVVLESVAVALRDAGCLRGWRNELLDVVGEGRCLGVIERAALRPLGLLTRAVHLNAWTPDGRLWVARRSLTKTTNPGLLDTLVGGLAGAGETMDESLLRESHEEAGLTSAHLASRSALLTLQRMHRRLPEGYQVEDVLISECVLPSSVQPVNLDGEVSEFLALTPDEVWPLLCDDQFTLEAELVVLESLRARLSATA